MVNLSLVAADRSTYLVEVSFYDETSTLVTPDSCTWSLHNEFGAVINEREDVVVESLLPTISIVLSDDDLVYSQGQFRFVTVKATYTSDAGSGLPSNAACRFSIEDIAGVL